MTADCCGLITEGGPVAVLLVQSDGRGDDLSKAGPLSTDPARPPARPSYVCLSSCPETCSFPRAANSKFYRRYSVLTEGLSKYDSELFFLLRRFYSIWTVYTLLTL
jgi:hypothetical protein